MSNQEKGLFVTKMFLFIFVAMGAAEVIGRTILNII